MNPEVEVKISQRILRKGKRVGMFVGVKMPNGKARLGYSLCSKYDIYNQELAMKIAISRAESNKGWEVPSSLLVDFEYFYERCQRYFKEDLED